MSVQNHATSGLQQFTYSTILLVSLPFMNSVLTPTMNFPYTGSLNIDYGVSISDPHGHAIGLSIQDSQLRVLEEFATRLLARTKDLDADIARALQEDFLYLYEPI